MSAGSFVDHQGPNTLQAKDVRQSQSDGSGPDDDDVRYIRVLADRYRPNRESTCKALNVLASSY